MSGPLDPEKLRESRLSPNFDTGARPICNVSRENLRSPWAQLVLFGIILVIVLVLHVPLLRLPYLWDEAGYYVPAARDLLNYGSLIPRSTVSNAHPPLVMAWLAASWRIGGFRPETTRVAMLAIAAFTLMGSFRLAATVANKQVAVASTLCLALYSVFFSQASLAQLDVAAAGFTLWGLHSYLNKPGWATALWFSLAALSKETAVLAPLAMLAALLMGKWRYSPIETGISQRRLDRESVLLIVPVLTLAVWFSYHYARTGHVFGNPEFFRYNITATLHPLRILLAAALRLWQLTGYMNLWLLTGAGIFAMYLPPRREIAGERPRIPVPTQTLFAFLIAGYLVTMAAIGGAVLARYMLPVLPLVLILWTSTLWRRVPYWWLMVLIVCLAFISAWFINPPYGFPFEDNLAYRDYILLHEDAAHFLVEHRPKAPVLTAWPASDELTRPYLGYVGEPMRVVRVDDFSLENVMAAADARSQFDTALVFSTKYEPPRPLLRQWPGWQRIKAEFFGFHRDLAPAAAAQVLGGEVVYSAARDGQWIAVIEVRHAFEASARPSSAQTARR